MCRPTVVALLYLLYSSLQSAVYVCAESQCVSTLPQSEAELRSLVEAPSPPNRTHLFRQVRLFPNITFSCSGSVVGWSMITPLYSSRGGRPKIQIWRSAQDDPTLFHQKNRSLLYPCLQEVISEDSKLYLYTNITEQPLEFEPGDILGMLVRREEIAAFRPYFIARDSFVSYNRSTLAAGRTERLMDMHYDDMMPLLFLHICSREDGDYEECISNTRRLPTCLENPVSTKTDDSAVSSTVLIVAVTVPLSLTLLIVTVVLAVTLLCVGLSRRRRKRREKHNKNSVPTITENTDIVGDVQPYAEPYLAPSSLPSRSQTPLPPPPTHAPPPPGLSVPTYAVLDGPSPSPPPPYILDLELSRQPRLSTLQSPQYESIDNNESGSKKAALLRQNATETSQDSAGYAELKLRDGEH